MYPLREDRLNSSEGLRGSETAVEENTSRPLAQKLKGKSAMMERRINWIVLSTPMKRTRGSLPTTAAGRVSFLYGWLDLKASLSTWERVCSPKPGFK